MAIVSKALVLDLISYGDNIKEFSLKIEKYVPYEPGQFLQLTLDNEFDYNAWPESRPFSMANSYNNEKIIKLVIKNSGKFTNRIFNELKIGSTCHIKYPYGDFTLPEHVENINFVFIAAGTGITPILSFIDYLKTRKITNIGLLYSFGRENEYVSLQDLIKTMNSIKLFCTREKNKKYINRRMDANDALSMANDIKSTHFFICGPKDFTDSISKGLNEKGVKNIHTEDWE